MAFRYIQLLTCNFLSPADWLARYLRDNKFLFSQKVAESITNKRDRCLIKIKNQNSSIKLEMWPLRPERSGTIRPFSSFYGSCSKATESWGKGKNGKSIHQPARNRPWPSFWFLKWKSERLVKHWSHQNNKLRLILVYCYVRICIPNASHHHLQSADGRWHQMKFEYRKPKICNTNLVLYFLSCEVCFIMRMIPDIINII